MSEYHEEAGNEGELHPAQVRLFDAKAANEEARLYDHMKAQDWVSTQDTDHGYFEFSDQISEGSVDNFTEVLRRFSRLRPGDDITIMLCSPGGDIIQGFRLFDDIVALRQAGHHVTIKCRGQVASMALIVLQAADYREVGSTCHLMLHRAAFGAMGKAFEIEDQVEFVKGKLEKKICDILGEASGKGADHFLELLGKRKDLWYDADSAVEEGLADEVA